jgi:hypothetical protein
MRNVSTFPGGRFTGRSLVAVKPHGVETREVRHLRAIAKRDVRQAVLYGNPARGQSSYAGAGMGTSDRVPNPKSKRYKPRGSKIR